MSIPVVAVLLIAAVLLGWVARELNQEAPGGTDLRYWRTMMRRRRRMIFRRLMGRRI